MNCQQFTSFIVEVARGRMLDAAARDGALRHTGSCQACAARLAQEQSLSDALRAVASDMKELGAPARLEAKLLAAFHETRATSPATSTGASPAAPDAKAPITALSSRRRASRRVAFAATAVAASLVLTALAMLYSRFTPTAPPLQQQEITTNNVLPPGDTGSSPADAARKTAAAPTPLPTPDEPAVQFERGRPRSAERAATQRTTPKLARRAPPTMIASRQVIDGGSAVFEAGEGETALDDAGGSSAAARPNEAESVSEFISLVAGAPATTPLESGQLVRVQMPRAALASFGLPLNAERGNEPVKADVLLGNDGLARAIRFVR